MLNRFIITYLDHNGNECSIHTFATNEEQARADFAKNYSGIIIANVSKI